MLYIGSVKFVDDERFELLPGNGYGDWTLRFRLIRESDAGKYECQISTSPKLSQTFTLNVVGMYFNYLIKGYAVKDTAIPYRARTGPEQGFPCVLILTGKNLFSLQGTPLLIATFLAATRVRRELTRLKFG